MENLIPVYIAFALDLLIGDPHILYHPVQFMGLIIERLHSFTEKSKHPVLAGGVYPAVLIALSLAFMGAVRLLPEPLRMLVTVYILYSSLAAHSLAKEVLKVLKIRGIAERRRALSMLCSRDTDALDDRGILSTLFETNSENSVDGVLAPLFYMIVFAPLGCSAEAALIYKAVSTCDSMVGYKNERFLHIGKISARLDDALNLIPARVSVLFILSAGFLFKLLKRVLFYPFFTSTAPDGNIIDSLFDRPLRALRNGVKIYLRNRYKHASPNSAHPMSAFAGIFGVKICGPVPYFGKLVDKPYIGDPLTPLTDRIVRESAAVMVLSAALMLTTGSLVFGCMEF